VAQVSQIVDIRTAGRSTGRFAEAGRPSQVPAEPVNAPVAFLQAIEVILLAASIRLLGPVPRPAYRPQASL
jgi:hypothetical protein